MNNTARQVDLRALISHIIRGDGMDKCRICLGDTSEGKVFLTDPATTIGNKDISVSELFEMVSGVEINEEPLCPKSVCVNCVSTALAVQEFRNFVQTSARMWMKAVNGLAVLPFAFTSPMKSLCAFIRPNDLGIQTIKNYASDRQSVIEKLMEGSTKKPIMKKSETEENDSPCICIDCRKKFPTPYFLAKHLMSSGQKEACLTCGKIVLRGENMKEHMKLVHNTDVILCTDCPLLFKTKELLEEHRAQHQLSSFTCKYCGRNFPTRKRFEQHAQMHLVRTCKCGRKFTNRSCYQEHKLHCQSESKSVGITEISNHEINIQSTQKCETGHIGNFKCDYCSKMYMSRAQLKNHILWIHMDVRPHECNWCKERFFTPAQLTEHSLVHTRAKKYECNICGARLMSKINAVHHHRMHTGEKPFRCEYCGQCFLSAWRRTEHERKKHKRGNRLQCPYCLNTYMTRHELNKHIDKAHMANELED